MSTPLRCLSDADLETILGGAVGDPIGPVVTPITPTIVCPVGTTYDTTTRSCIKQVDKDIEIVEL